MQVDDARPAQPFVSSFSEVTFSDVPKDAPSRIRLNLKDSKKQRWRPIFTESHSKAHTASASTSNEEQLAFFVERCKKTALSSMEVLEFSGLAEDISFDRPKHKDADGVKVRSSLYLCYIY